MPRTEEKPFGDIQDTRLGVDYARMLNQLPRVVMLIDLNGIIRYLNEGAKHVFGYNPDELVGTPVWSLYKGRNKKDFMNDLNHLEEGNILSIEMEGKHKDGSTVWVDVKRVMIENDEGEQVILGSASDISLQKNAELKLSENQARLQAILETTVEGIITINEEGVIKSFNCAAERMFGYTSEEVIGENVEILMPEPYRSDHDDYIANYMETGDKKIIGIGREVKGKRKDGTEFPMELSVSEVKWEGERIFTGIVKDITDRRRLEKEVLEISEEERRRIGQEMHDDLGQMLTGIHLISQNLARKLKINELPGAEEVQEIASLVKEADEHARGLARGLVHIELDSAGLKTAMEQMCKRAQRFFMIDCRFEEDGEVSLSDYATALNLFRIAQEAVNNAVKHGNASCVRVLLEGYEEKIEIRVIDDGIGFDHEDNRQKEGGMGLHIMNYRANLLGGQLKIGTTEEGHTLVRCSVPRPQQEE